MSERGPASSPLASPQLIVAAVFVAVAVVLGGGGSSAPTQELVVELAALLSLGMWVVLPRRPHPPQDRLVWIAAASFAAIPLLQLVPLPPALWHALPNRAVEVDALRLVGAAEMWRPVSISPWRTLASALSLLPPFAMMLFASPLGGRERHALYGVVAALGVAAALQLASGGAEPLRLYARTSLGVAVGSQANRNRSADILLTAMLALLAFVAPLPRVRTLAGRLAVAALLALFAISVLLTGSRMGSALLLAVLLRSLPVFLGAGRPRRLIGGAVLAVAGAGALVAALSGNAALQRTMVRFQASGDARFAAIWPDTVEALRAYWPVGSGVGTFVPAFEPVERLEVVDRSNPIRAHNDYLEYALEAGLAGLAALVLLAGAAARGIASLWRAGGASRQTAILTMSFTLISAIHSIVDYPMRSMSLAVLAGMVAGLIAGRESGRELKQVRRGLTHGERIADRAGHGRPGDLPDGVPDAAFARCRAGRRPTRPSRPPRRWRRVII